MRPWVVAVAMLAAPWSAGCADPGSPAAADAAPTGTGTLLGVVVDDSVRPLDGVAIQATGASGLLNATTGPDGVFRFDDLAPGVYIVLASKPFYSPHQQAVDVREGVDDPPVARFQLPFQAGSVPYVELYKFDGFFECSVWPTNGCANVNILTGIVFCSLGIPCFNVTSDRSVELIPIVPHPGFVQTELVWEATNEFGRALMYEVGAATREELQDGMSNDFNYTEGESPLMATLQDEALEESRLGIAGRQLELQVWSGRTMDVPGGCGDPDDPCGIGVNLQQPYTTYTHAFFGYEPPAGWLFTDTGQAPPPPA